MQCPMLRLGETEAISRGACHTMVLEILEALHYYYCSYR